MTLQRKPIDLIGWHLISQADMLDALAYLSDEGWRGAVSFDSTNATWRLELNADTACDWCGNPIRNLIATIGDWLIDDMGLRKLTDAEFGDNYAAAG